jgi:hypothetical protein
MEVWKNNHSVISWQYNEAQPTNAFSLIQPALLIGKCTNVTRPQEKNKLPKDKHNLEVRQAWKKNVRKVI